MRTKTGTDLRRGGPGLAVMAAMAALSACALGCGGGGHSPKDKCLKIANAIDDASATNINARTQMCDTITDKNRDQVLAYMTKECYDAAASAWNADGVPDPVTQAQYKAGCDKAVK